MGRPPDHCPECGATHGGGCNCSTSEDAATVAEFRLLPAGDCAGRQSASPAVHLIREFKGPTVEGFLMDGGEAIERLPGQVCEAADAIEAADYQRASDRLDASIGALLRGPGFCRRRRRGFHLLMPLALLMFLALLTVTVVLWLA